MGHHPGSSVETAGSLLAHPVAAQEAGRSLAVARILLVVHHTAVGHMLVGQGGFVHRDRRIVAVEACRMKAAAVGLALGLDIHSPRLAAARQEIVRLRAAGLLTQHFGLLQTRMLVLHMRVSSWLLLLVLQSVVFARMRPPGHIVRLLDLAARL